MTKRDATLDRIAVLVLLLNIVFLQLSILVPSDYRFKLQMVVHWFTIMVVLVCLTGFKFDFKFRPTKSMLLVAIVGASFIINGIMFSFVGYMAIGGTVLIVYPVLGLVSKDDDIKKRLFRICATAFHLSFYVLIVLSLTIGPEMVLGQYCSVIANPNGLGNYLNAVIISEVFLLVLKDKNKVIHLVSLGGAMSLLIFAASRTAILGVIFSGLFFLVYIIKRYADWKKVLSLVLSIVVVSAVFVPINYYLIDKVNPVVKEKVLETIEPMEGLHKVLSDPATFRPRSWEYTEEMLDEEEDMEDLEDAMGFFFLRMFKGIGGKGTFGSGRARLWAEFFSATGLVGHQKEEMELSTSVTYYDAVNAHNTYIQLGYSAGLIAGIAFLIYIIVLLLKICKEYRAGSIKEGENVELLFIATALGIFMAQSLLSYTFCPAITWTAMIFWIGSSNLLWK